MRGPRFWSELDRTRWSAAQRDTDIFSPPGIARNWASSTRYQVEWTFDHWLQFLETYYGPIEGDTLDHATAEKIVAFIKHCGRTAGGVTLTNYANNLVRMFKAMDPLTDWSWVMKGLKPYLESEKVRKALPNSRVFVDSHVLYACGVELMKSARALKGPRLDQSIQYRDGLMIALLAARPIRRRNLAMIRIGSHLRQIGIGWALSFSPEETKNKQALEFTIPWALNDYIERYIGMFRPDFPSSDSHNALWASGKGGPLQSDACYNAITKRTKESLGFPVNPHEFRHCAVTTIAEKDPESILMATKLLGHSDPRMTEEHYNRSLGLKASVAYQKQIEDLMIQTN